MLNQQQPKTQVNLSLPQKNNASQVSNGSKWSTDDH
jgi:hypothetical protein